jgi:hypothetical protein
MNNPVCAVHKNSLEVVQFNLEEFKGHKLADLRIYCQQEGKGLIPTKKGISIPISLWPQFKAGLVKMEEAILAAGWLAPEDLEIQE